MCHKLNLSALDIKNRSSAMPYQIPGSAMSTISLRLESMVSLSPYLISGSQPS